MCGILALINIKSDSSTSPLVNGTDTIEHRGPDDEGYLLWDGQRPYRTFIGKNSSNDSRVYHNLENLPGNAKWMVGLGHRRLSIIDLSPAGHQPMVDPESGLAMVFNGEIYNYRELRSELELLGHRFKTATDSEVLLKSWKEWGVKAPERFNGMFGFVILDTINRKLYAVRDRYGIKPLYFAILDKYIAFASEIKQIRVLPEFKAQLNDLIAMDYLSQGLLDHSHETFDEQVKQLKGGEMATIEIRGTGSDFTSSESKSSSPSGKITIRKWYNLNASKWTGNAHDAEQQFRELFKDSVNYRLRADVPVGSCLSGGLDSSAIVCQAAELLRENDKHQGQKTVTASYKIGKYDEWEYASEVIKRTGAESYRIWPTSQKLLNDLDRLLWHMDEPFGSTSQFSQWSVFEGAAQAGLKVMLDGQGADEMLAGYGGNDVPLYAGLLKKKKFLSLYKNYTGFKSEFGYPPKGQMLHAFSRIYPFLNKLHQFSNHKQPDWLSNKEWNTDIDFNTTSLSDEMRLQTTISSLPALLRYEDRNSMAFSIESRVPFLDHRLVEFLLGLPEELVYHKGIRKVILRNAFRTHVPDKVLDRKDKMGFVSPEEVWLKKKITPWFKSQVRETLKLFPDWFEEKQISDMLSDMINNERVFTFEPWRILCFGRWFSLMK